ncbi:hypothetical protein KIN20_014869 [Parelaphostrongylus tenuis]|uniref:Uncharacterized protein n=1 Tax=Parelaphostrongylus tenuis TaxID=148309 RepID=A0AAD5MHK3_PARTN|nr:hypothetical protein KIN20_014869 [Parelaphostrongylus tenuis]
MMNFVFTYLLPQKAFSLQFDKVPLNEKKVADGYEWECKKEEDGTAEVFSRPVNPPSCSGHPIGKQPAASYFNYKKKSHRLSLEQYFPTSLIAVSFA